MSAAGNPEAGVTLLEALVVIAIMALIAGLMAPNIGASLDLLSLRQSAAVLQADLRVARATALRTGAAVTVKPLPGGRGYDWIGGTRHLPETTVLSMSAPVSFLPDGSLIPASISIAAGARRIPIAIDTTTGAIKAGGR
ncbi:MAG TPA: prepilin-type N-terminal cleavage/methylation domain-containing protein [Rhizomicrobium sp.]|nr:prepilin-type N-terminal cleavage/methylation domain-containing protein [Rhizomicrobium sp.]